MRFRLLLVLLAPTLTGAILVAMLAESTRSRSRQADGTARVANAAQILASLDEALGSETVAAATGVSPTDLERRFVTTDARLKQMEQLERTPLTDTAIATVERIVRRRSDIVTGVVSPLQIGDRYSHARAAIRDVARDEARTANPNQTTQSISALLSLMDAQSAHVDERLAIDLALRYDSWAPGQLAVAVGAIERQKRHVLATADEDLARPSNELLEIRRVLTTTNALPADLDASSWGVVSNAWAADLTLAIGRLVDTVTHDAAKARREASGTGSRAIGIGVGGIVVAIAVALLAAIGFVRRLNEIAVATTALAMRPEGEIFIGDHRQDDIGEVARAFDQMAGEIRRITNRGRRQAAVMQSIAEQRDLHESLSLCDELVARPGSFRLEQDTTLQFVNGDGTVCRSASDLGAADGLGGTMAWDLALTAVRRTSDLEDLKRRADRDELTGLLNRSATIDALQGACADPSAAPGLLFVDLDRFKEVNDRFGHEKGDAVLASAARHIAAAAALHGGITGRFGGDEFVIVVPQASDARLDRIGRSTVRAVEQVRRETCTEIGASVGAALRRSGYGHEELLVEADLAMYAAKRDGTSSVVVASDELRSELDRSKTREQRLRRTLTANDLDVHYQPILSVDGSQLVALEALVRPGPTFGQETVSAFISEAERLGLTYEIDVRVATAVARQVTAWRSPGAEVPIVSINLSAQTLARRTLEADLCDVLEITGCSASWLCLEVTEETMISDLNATSLQLERLRGLGFLIAIDDFGTGYSSLAYLANLPADVLKIDRAFVSHVDTNPRNTSVVETVIRLAESLGMTSLAEGVEREEELAHLAGLGCDLAQGYLLSRALPAERVTELLDRNSNSISIVGQLAAVAR